MRERHRLQRDCARRHSRGGQQRGDPGSRGGPQALESEPRDGAVLSQDGCDVGDRADRRQVGQVGDRLDRRDTAELLQQERGHLQRDAAPGQASIRVGRVRPLGIHDRDGAGKDVGDAVMVRDDDVDPLLRGRRRLGDARGARVHGDQQAAALGPGRLDRAQRQAVAVVQPAGHVGDDVHAEPSQRGREDREAGQPIRVEVAHDEDPLALPASLLHALDDLLGVRQETRVVQADGRGPEERLELAHAHAAAAQDPREQRGSTVGCHGGHERLVEGGAVGVAPAIARDQHPRRIACPGHRRLHRALRAHRARAAGHAEGRRTGRPEARSLRRASHSSQTVSNGAALKMDE